MCVVPSLLAHGCSVFGLSREVIGLSVCPLVKLRLPVESLCPLRYRGKHLQVGWRSLLGPNCTPRHDVEGMNICIYQPVVNEKNSRV